MVSIGSRARADGLDLGSKFATNVARGLVVATAGGLVAQLSGGSFALGFVTAGLAFAINEVLQGGVVEKMKLVGKVVGGQQSN